LATDLDTDRNRSNAEGTGEGVEGIQGVAGDHPSVDNPLDDRYISHMADAMIRAL
jgi:hypothetical protein